MYSLIKFASISSVDWWGYYGLFLTGNFEEILNEKYIQQIKSIVSQDNQFIFVFKSIKDFMFDHNFYLIPFNFIPSFFGMYYLTVSNLNSILNLILFVGTIILNFYLILILFKNLSYYIQRENNLSILFVSSITGFFVLVLFFFF